MKKVFLFAVGLVLLLTACQGGPTVQVTPPPGETEPATQAVEEATSAPVAPATATDVPEQTATSEPSTPTIAPTEAAAAPSGFASGEPVDAVIAAFRKLTEQSAFRVEQTINSPTDGTMVMNMDIIPPFRYRMTSEGFGLMIIDGVTYMQASEDQWVQTGNMGDNFVSIFTWINSESEAEEFRKLVTNAEFVGEEALDGETTRRYQYDLIEPSENTYLRNHLWVGADGLPRKLEVLISTSVAGETDQGSVINVYKDFGSPDIVIEPPG